jgi:hypothetical protein
MIRAEERSTSVLQRVAYWRQLVDAGREADLIAELRRVWPNFRYDDLTPAADPAPWPRQGGFHMGLVARAGVVLRNAHRLPREER